MGSVICGLWCCLSCPHYVTTMKAMNAQDDIASVPIDCLQNQSAPVIDLTLRQDTAENFQYPKLVGKSVKLEWYTYYFCSKTRYWTHVFGKTNPFCCGWQKWLSWEEYLKRVTLLSSKFSFVYLCSSLSFSVQSFQLMFQFIPPRLEPLRKRSLTV